MSEQIQFTLNITNNPVFTATLTEHIHFKTCQKRTGNIKKQQKYENISLHVLKAPSCLFGLFF